ncbi:MAG TPA: YncE family protein [Polyangia bacterium]|nr:YncE family protein [Polyangia bacterium]
MLAAIAALLLPALATAAPTAKPAPKPAPAEVRPERGALVQLPGPRGCVVDRVAKAKAKGCGRARALEGPGPFMGSRAIAVSDDGRNVYVAASRSNAITIFRRNPGSGALSQAAGVAGCIASKAIEGCGRAIGLGGVNSLALSPDGRNVYATARGSDAVTAFQRNPSTGALRQLPGSAGCWSGLPIPGCGQGRAVVGPDVLVASPDGRNVYVGSFFGNAVAVFAREAKGGGLTQPAGTAGCIAAAMPGCATALALGSPEGLGISPNGASLYVASSTANALLTLVRDPSTGALAQASDGSGCIVDAPLTGCSNGVQIEGANAIALAGGKDVYVTSLLSDSVTSFSRASNGVLTQLPNTSACLVFLRSAGCSFGRALSGPEGIAVAPGGANVYVTSFLSGAIDVLDRNPKTGVVVQRPGSAGCLAAATQSDCTPARALKGVASLALSPDGRNLYSTSFGSNAVDVFRRNK